MIWSQTRSPCFSRFKKRTEKLQEKYKEFDAEKEAEIKAVRAGRAVFSGGRARALEKTHGTLKKHSCEEAVMKQGCGSQKSGSDFGALDFWSLRFHTSDMWKIRKGMPRLNNEAGATWLIPLANVIA